MSAVADTVPVTVEAAARAENVTAKTVRQWLRDGAPCVRQGKSGPGNGALVRVGDLRRWRQSRAGLACSEDHGRALEHFADALLDTLRRDSGNGVPAPFRYGVPVTSAAALFIAAYRRAFRALNLREPDDGDLPEAVVQLLRIAGTEPEGSHSLRSAEMIVRSLWQPKDGTSTAEES